MELPIVCRPLRGLHNFLVLHSWGSAALHPGRGPQPSISAGVRNFMLSPATAGWTLSWLSSLAPPREHRHVTPNRRHHYPGDGRQC